MELGNLLLWCCGLASAKVRMQQANTEKVSSGRNREDESTDTEQRDRATRISDETRESEWSEGVALLRFI